MGPLPKRKVSKSRRNRRRAHDALQLKHLVVCDGCGEYHIAHRVCDREDCRIMQGRGSE